MKDISEYKIIGNYLVNLYEKQAISSIKYENARALSTRILEKLNKNGTVYNILPIQEKTSIVQAMINSGVFKTNVGNKMIPFSQVYSYEVSKQIFATYSCDGNLTFKLSKDLAQNKEQILKTLREIFCNNVYLDIQNAINLELRGIKSTVKTRGV